MKILHITASLETGGAQKLIHDLAIIQKKQGKDVTILVYFRCRSMLEMELETLGIRIISLECKNIRSIKVLLKTHRILKYYDIVHVHLFPSLYQLALASIGSTTPMVYTEHSTYNRRREKRFLRPIEKFVYSRYSKVVAISEQTREALLKWLRPKNSTKFQTIPNGVDTERYTKAKTESVERIYGRSGIPILMVSRFVPAKDQSTLIRAIRYIKNPDAFVAFAGDGEKIGEMKRLAMESEVGHRCVFLGNRDDVPELIKAAAIGVQSSHWEGFGLTAAEFMAAGKPVVASSVEGLKQVVEGAGELFPAGDEKTLAEKLNRLLSDANHYKTMAETCQRRSQKYDISAMALQYKKLYQELLLLE